MSRSVLCLLEVGRVQNSASSLTLSGRYSNINKKPLIFDPVAVGATSFRRDIGQGARLQFG